MGYFQVSYIDDDESLTIKLDVDPQHYESAAFYAVKQIKNRLDKDGKFNAVLKRNSMSENPKAIPEDQTLNQTEPETP